LSAPVEYDQLRKPFQGVTAKTEKRVRTTHGGRIVPLTRTDLRWYAADVETAQNLADQGHIRMAAKLWQACQTNGVIKGVLGTRSSGLLRLPRSFSGDTKHVAALTGDSTTNRPGQFDLYMPPTELALLEADAVGLGVAVGEFLPVVGRKFPVFARLPPEFLRYSPTENRWYYRSLAGELLITPGDGRWFLHCPGGRVAPWNTGCWAAVGNAWITNLHANEYESNWEAKLAHPARFAKYPQGANEAAQQGWFDQVGAWGVNTVFEAPPGYDVELIESNGIGHQSFGATMSRADRNAIIAIAGQSISTDGGSGFQNNDIHETIREDLIQFSGDALAHTINTQAMPQHAHKTGYDTNNPGQVGWDTTSPKKRAQVANSWKSVGEGLKMVNNELKNYGVRVQIGEVLNMNGIKVEALNEKTTTQAIELGVETRVAVTRVFEARAADGLPELTMPDGSRDPDNDLTVAAFKAKQAAQQQVEGAAEGAEESGTDPDAVNHEASETELAPEESGTE